MSVHYKGTEEEIAALDAFIKLVRAANSALARIHARLACDNLTESQFGALEALLHLGPMSQRLLGQKLLKSPGNITMVVDNLEKRGLVKRERGLDDRRVLTVRLTEKGRQLITDIFPRHVRSIVEEMSVLTPTELEELGRLCRKIGLHEAEGEETHSTEAIELEYSE